MDSLKFNVDSFAKGNPGPAGIWGMLRNSNCRVLCLFSLFVGNLDSNSSEIMAIHQALTLCVSNPLVMEHKVTIVSDSKTVVSWTNSNNAFGSIDHLKIVYDIKDILFRFNNLEMIFNPRASNSFTDSLAKLGRAVAVKEWCEAAKVFVNNYKPLLSVEEEDLGIHYAAFCGRKEIVRYLLSVTEKFALDSGALLLIKLINYNLHG
ncbi:hypothetical protein Dsin_023915 [Dipteronia sinensis]|uniref:RNase H type-1 domain-containing protein n=1 Tax=Dipteronia sinensis TaxID=43782 RepID=A0AAE0E141_9ROSI|nr:hypothetical protein Dsin_023915 [Dipteronia sinensis]